MTTKNEIKELLPVANEAIICRVQAGLKMATMCQKLNGYELSISDIEKAEYRDITNLSKPMLEREADRISDVKKMYSIYAAWKQITVSHDKGNYVFTVPFQQPFYNLFLKAIGGKVEAVEIECIESFELSCEIIASIKKAVKFVGKDDLHPVFSNVMLEIGNNQCKAVSTDAHYLFTSIPYPIQTSKEYKLLIPTKDALKISKLKGPQMCKIIDGQTIQIGECTVVLFDGNYPNYMVILPTYDHSTVFETTQFKSIVKQSLATANKTTSMVSMTVNGTIKLQSEDRDFEYSGTSQMNYVSSNIDFTIGFSGKRMLTCLEVMDDYTQFETDGNRNQGMYLKSKDSTILLMPLIN